MSYKFYGFNCHLDEEHLKDHTVTEEDVSNILNYCEYVKLELPKELSDYMRKAKGVAECHSAAHEGIDYLMTIAVEQDSDILMSFFSLFREFRKEDNIDRVKELIKEKRDKQRNTCKVSFA